MYSSHTFNICFAGHRNEQSSFPTLFIFQRYHSRPALCPPSKQRFTTRFRDLSAHLCDFFSNQHIPRPRPLEHHKRTPCGSVVGTLSWSSSLWISASQLLLATSNGFNQTREFPTYYKGTHKKDPPFMETVTSFKRPPQTHLPCLQPGTYLNLLKACQRRIDRPV